MKKTTIEFKEFLEAKGFKVENVNENVRYTKRDSEDFFKYNYRESNDDLIYCTCKVKTRNFKDEDWESSKAVMCFKIKSNGLIEIYTDTEEDCGDICLGTFDFETAKAFIEVMNKRK